MLWIADCASAALPPNDDGSSSQVRLPFSLNFFGTTYDSLYVNNNGNVTFDAPLDVYIPFDLRGAGRVIIAPFFADIDTREPGSGNVTYSGADLTYNDHPAFCVSWTDVGYFSRGTDKRNRFQLVLIDRSDVGPDDFDIMFNYGQIQWDTAASPLATSAAVAARAGFSNGGELSYELPGSAVAGAFLDSNSASGLIHSQINASVQGRYVYEVRNGAVSDGDHPLPQPTIVTAAPYVTSTSISPTPVATTAPSDDFVWGCAGFGQCPTTEPSTRSPSPVVTAQTPISPPSSKVTFWVTNSADRDICELYIRPSGSSEWGDNRLGRGMMISPGWMSGYNLLPAVYDARAVDCEHQVVQEAFQLDARQGYRWQVNGVSAQPPTPAASVTPDTGGSIFECAQPGGCSSQAAQSEGGDELVLTGADWLNGNGVDVFYPRQGGQWDPNKQPPENADGTLPYQCVELVVRLYKTLGYPNWTWVRNAADMTDVEGRAGFEDVSFISNASTTPPRPGDILVWPISSEQPYGHVAIISRIAGTTVEIVQQNVWPAGKPQPIDTLTLVQDAQNRFAISGVLGWIHSPKMEAQLSLLHTISPVQHSNRHLGWSQDPDTIYVYMSDELTNAVYDNVAWSGRIVSVINSDSRRIFGLTSEAYAACVTRYMFDQMRSNPIFLQPDAIRSVDFTIKYAGNRMWMRPWGGSHDRQWIEIGGVPCDIYGN